MRELSTGELGKLFEISKYKIRHYIDQGILVPQQRPENGYYFFGEGEIYRLYQIMIFRKIGFSIQEINESLALENSNSILAKGEVKIQAQIDELLAVQQTLRQIIEAQKENKLNELVFIERDRRYFKQIAPECIEGESLNYFKLAKSKLGTIEEPYYIYSEESPAVLCLQSEVEDGDFIMPEGIYGCKSFVVEDQSSLENQIDEFLADALIKNKLDSYDKLLVYENIYCSLAYRDLMIYTIEVKL